MPDNIGPDERYEQVINNSRGYVARMSGVLCWYWMRFEYPIPSPSLTVFEYKYLIKRDTAREDNGDFLCNSKS